LNQYNPLHIAEDGLFVHSAVKGAIAKASASEAEVTVETNGGQ
jgi:hypothetical protein